VRILLWLLLLVCVFGAVSLYHSRFTADAREKRGAAQAAAESGRTLPEGYQARVIVGEKSGAPIVEGARPVAPQAPAGPDPKARTAPAPKPSPAGATTHVVKRGESLSTISDKYYGTSRPEVVQALAKFNKLKSANALREGQALAIPPLADLGVPAK
jgi:nucleoid-associated protein YgaU